MSKYTVTLEDQAHAACKAWDAVCSLDAHAGAAAVIGPLITTLLTVGVASAGWWWTRGQSNRGLKRLKLFIRMAGVKAVNGIDPVMDKVATETNIGPADIAKVDANLADFTLLVEGLGVADWPSPGVYIAARALRDRIIVLRNWTEPNGLHHDDYWPLAQEYAKGVKDAFGNYTAQIARA